MKTRPEETEAFIESALRFTGDGCLEWPFARDHDGYGVKQIDGRQWRVPRVICGALAGRVLAADELALHSCDNPPCVNPRHLRIGTIRDNAQDAKDRGRNIHGGRHHETHFTDADIMEIRRAYAFTDASQQDLAEQWGVEQAAIGSIVKGKTWAHLPLIDGGANRKRAGVTGGPNAVQSPLTDEDVLSARALYAMGGVTQAALARRFGVKPNTMAKLLQGKTWRRLLIDEGQAVGRMCA